MSKSISSLILVAVMLAAISTVSAQQIHLPPAVSQSQGMGNVPVRSNDDTQRKQAMAVNLQRQAEMKRDGEKLAQLTQELNDYLQNKGEGVISVDALKKAEQIEKLAHSVKSKMKQSF
jgi:biopolymer transport protein ExbD